jgi:hypothetical protein
VTKAPECLGAVSRGCIEFSGIRKGKTFVCIAVMKRNDQSLARRVSFLLAIFGIILIFGMILSQWHRVAVWYYLHKLRTHPETLCTFVGASEGSLRALALTAFVQSEKGSHQLMELCTSLILDSVFRSESGLSVGSADKLVCGLRGSPGRWRLWCNMVRVDADGLEDGKTFDVTYVHDRRSMGSHQSIPALLLSAYLFLDSGSVLESAEFGLTMHPGWSFRLLRGDRVLHHAGMGRGDGTLPDEKDWVVFGRARGMTQDSEWIDFCLLPLLFESLYEEDQHIKITARATLARAGFTTESLAGRLVESLRSGALTCDSPRSWHSLKMTASDFQLAIFRKLRLHTPLSVLSSLTQSLKTAEWAETELQQAFLVYMDFGELALPYLNELALQPNAALSSAALATAQEIMQHLSSLHR